MLIFNRLLQNMTLQVKYQLLLLPIFCKLILKGNIPSKFILLKYIKSKREINIPNYTYQEKSQKLEKPSNHKAYNQQKNNQKISLQKGKDMIC